MPVIGINLKAVKATKIDKDIINVKVNNKADTTNVREENLPGIGEHGLLIDFEFSSIYNSDGKEVARIDMKGEVVYVGSDYKEIMKMWTKEKIIPEDTHIDIINTIFRRCVSKAIVLAEDIQLAPPIGLPFAQKKKKE
ncbi:MAG: hypothetical protein KJ697_03765 [Nanoarchaeota archaeon]|nr:hypothetical protein [Nanoarchaeota archaeon]MBU4124570.1 hypothetical protein [Nanoarchaeota archaeon]